MYSRISGISEIPYRSQYIGVEMPPNITKYVGTTLHVYSRGAKIGIFPQDCAHDGGEMRFIVDESMTGKPGSYEMAVMYENVVLARSRVEVLGDCAIVGANGTHGAPECTPVTVCSTPDAPPPHGSNVFGIGGCK